MATTGARIDTASSIFLVANSPAKAAENSQRYDTWRTTKPGYTLIFDVPGVYHFNAQTLYVPANSTLMGVAGVTLSCANDGTWFLQGSGTPFGVSSLTLEGNDRVDYVVQSVGTPSQAGNRANLIGVSVKSTRTLPDGGIGVSLKTLACIRGLNASFNVYGCAVAYGKIGCLFEACDGSVVQTLVGANQTECFVRVRGNLGGAPLATGGRMSLYFLRSGNEPPYVEVGLDLDGVAGCNVHGVTVEGASVANFRMRGGSSNVRIFGARANNAVPVIFDGCNNCYVYGGGIQTSTVRYLNNARSCRAFLVAEAGNASMEIRHEWDSSTPWVANVRPDGTVLSENGGQPTRGFWEKGDKVYRRTYGCNAGVGDPLGYVCTQAGNPGTFVPFFRRPC
jgi:hypothetical protein